MSIDLEHVKRVLTSEIKDILADTGIPSLSIALIRGDRVVWTEAFGYSNVRLKVPATSSTIYSVGSCLKPVTAMAVMQLVDDGKIGLDDPINKHLGDDAVNDLSKDDKPVTIRHLLSHYSGLSVSHEMLPLWKGRRPKSLQQLASELTAEQDPGTTYRYSNSSYALAGLLIEKVSGLSYEQYLVDRILKPLGVKVDGPIHPTPAMIEQMAFPYRVEERKPVPQARYRFDVYPAGDAYLSVPDMARILLTQINEGASILSRDSVKEMQTAQFGGDSGMDFGINEFAGDKLLIHAGGVPGFSTKFILSPNAKVGVYVASNAGDAHLVNNIVTQAAIDLLRGRKLGTGLLREVTGFGFQPAIDADSGFIRIVEVFPRSPARQAGLTVGDLVRKANGATVSGKSLPEFLRMIAGPADKPVKLELFDSKRQRTQTIELLRGNFLVPGS